MKKILLSLIFIILFAFSIASLTLALEAENSDLQVSRITTYDITEEEIAYRVNLENFIDKDMENLRVTVYIPDLDIRVITRRFDLDADKEITKKLILELPENVEPGEYLARITISNDDIRRVKHRYLEVR